VGELAHPHDPTLLNTGNILVFDNGFHRRLSVRNYSRVVEVNPKAKNIEWAYMDDPPHHFYGSFLSGCQRLPNGNTLICEGQNGRIFEVTGDGELVWEFISPLYYYIEDFGTSNQIFRAYRYGPDYEGLKGKTLDPDRFEWVLQEKGKLVASKKEKVQARLKMLGY
jgi:hypothetical protein